MLPSLAINRALAQQGRLWLVARKTSWQTFSAQPDSWLGPFSKSGLASGKSAGRQIRVFPVERRSAAIGRFCTDRINQGMSITCSQLFVLVFLSPVFRLVCLAAQVQRLCGRMADCQTEVCLATSLPAIKSALQRKCSIVPM